MIIKKFQGKTEEEATAKAKEELGLKTVIMNVRKYKTENQMSMKDIIPELLITCPKKYREFYRKTEKDLKACTGAEKIIFRS